MSQYYTKLPSKTFSPQSVHITPFAMDVDAREALVRASASAIQKKSYTKHPYPSQKTSSPHLVPNTVLPPEYAEDTIIDENEDEGLFAERGPFPVQIARFLNRSSTVQRKAFCVFCVVRGALWLSEGYPSAAPIWKQARNGEDVIPPTKPVERLESILRVADEVTYNTFPAGSVPSAFSFLKSLIRNVLATKKTVSFGLGLPPRTTSPYGSRQRGDYSSARQFDLCPSQAEGARVFSEALALTGGLSERVPGAKAAFVEEAIRFCATMVSFATEDTLTVIDDILENHLLLGDEP